MFDAALRCYIDPPLARAAGIFVAAGIPANAVTVTGFVIGMAALPAIAAGAYLVALALIAANRLCDGLDGAIARRTRLTDLGGYLDIALDFIFYASVPFGFALADPGRNALAAAFLVFSFIGPMVTFLAYAILAQKHGVTTDIRGRKSFYYLGGLTEGTETVATFVLMCLMPQHFALIAGIYGVMCWITTGTRIAAAVEAFAVRAPQEAPAKAEEHAG